jgi:hypothetical protein
MPPGVAAYPDLPAKAWLAGRMGMHHISPGFDREGAA